MEPCERTCYQENYKETFWSAWHSYIHRKLSLTFRSFLPFLNPPRYNIQFNQTSLKRTVEKRDPGWTRLATISLRDH